MPEDLKIELSIGMEFVMRNNETEVIDMFANFLSENQVVRREHIGVLRHV